MKWFKSLWLKIRKTNGLPPNNVLIPIVEDKPAVEVTKIKRTRKKKESDNGTSTKAQ